MSNRMTKMERSCLQIFQRDICSVSPELIYYCFLSWFRVDRHLLLSFLQSCCASKEKRRITASLLMTLQNKLDFSFPSAVSVFEQGNRKLLHLSATDCRSISSAIQLSDFDTELTMFDCQASEDALVELFPALRKTRVR